MKDLISYTEELQFLLSQVDSFYLGKCPLYDREVFVKVRKQIDGSTKWICMLERTKGWCIGKDGNWYYESTPSNRTNGFMSNTRFDTHEQAREAYKQHLLKGIKHPLYI